MKSGKGRPAAGGNELLQLRLLLYPHHQTEGDGRGRVTGHALFSLERGGGPADDQATRDEAAPTRRPRQQRPHVASYGSSQRGWQRKAADRDNDEALHAYCPRCGAPAVDEDGNCEKCSQALGPY